MTESNGENDGRFQVCVIQTDSRETCIPKNAILSRLQELGYSEEIIFGIKLALEEALANAVKHGNQNDASKKITVRYSITPEAVEVVVRDEGGGFRLESVPDCTCPERLLVPSGRGILLMRAYMDEICYRDEGREVYFRKNRNSPPCCLTAGTEVRRSIHFSGRVQGVGFRYTARSLAQGFEVVGFVKNLSNGEVEMVVEGTKPELDRFLSAVNEAMSRHISGVDVHETPATGEFTSFQITR